MNQRLLLLSSVMLRGYGVSIVADELSKRLPEFGWDVTIGCQNQDDCYSRSDIIKVGTDPTEIISLCQSLKIDVVLAQTTPYFELLPTLTPYFPTVVFEHGDPSPSFFNHDAEEREQIRQNKINHVYPNVSRVLTISHFLQKDIGWSQSQVVPNGSDHVRDFGRKTFEVTNPSRPLQVGALMRLGTGEALYKGVDCLRELANFYKDNPMVQFQIMGRGEENDRVAWESLGVTTHLNSSDEERSTYLRDLDVMFSPSMWEGFNLPIVEAAASGTVAVAFDTGAHPETTPFLARDLNDLIVLIDNWILNRLALCRDSEHAYKFARSKFVWSKSAQLLSSHLEEAVLEFSKAQPLTASKSQRVLAAIQREGLAGFLILLMKKTKSFVLRSLKRL